MRCFISATTPSSGKGSTIAADLFARWCKVKSKLLLLYPVQFLIFFYFTLVNMETKFTHMLKGKGCTASTTSPAQPSLAQASKQGKIFPSLHSSPNLCKINTLHRTFFRREQVKNQICFAYNTLSLFSLKTKIDKLYKSRLNQNKPPHALGGVCV